MTVEENSSPDASPFGDQQIGSGGDHRAGASVHRTHNLAEMVPLVNGRVLTITLQ